MARVSTSSELDSVPRPSRFTWSVWTFVAPVALVVCVLVLVSIARQAGWLQHGHAAKAHATRRAPAVSSAPAGSSASISYRARKGETLTDVAVRFGISIDRLKALNPAIPVAAKLTASRRIRLR